jgi:hypothetical protein
MPYAGQDDYQVGTPFIVSGWGTTSAGGSTSDVLRRVDVPHVPDTGKSAQISTTRYV